MPDSPAEVACRAKNGSRVVPCQRFESLEEKPVMNDLSIQTQKTNTNICTDAAQASARGPRALRIADLVDGPARLTGGSAASSAAVPCFGPSAPAAVPCFGPSAPAVGAAVPCFGPSVPALSAAVPCFGPAVPCFGPAVPCFG
jgi:hypothetical protein